MGETMAFLLDTCAVSEMVSAMPSSKVLHYLSSLPKAKSHICSLSIGEVLFGIHLLPASAKRRKLETWYSNWLVPHFGDRILPMDFAVLERWGPMCADLRQRGFMMPVKDSLIAACALEHGLTVVTRNEQDFVHCGLSIANPWK